MRHAAWQMAGLLFLAVSASAQEIQAPPAGTEFAIKCTGSRGAEGEFAFRVAENAGGRVRVERANDPRAYRLAPVWAYMAGDIYEELGTAQGVNRMTQLSGPKEGLTKLADGARFSAEYRWTTPQNEANRTHTISVRGPAKVKTEAFGEQEVYEITDEISGPMHQMRRQVQYAPALRMTVSYDFRNARTGFAQNCVLVSLRTP
jgi:hypothetical protein